MIEYSQSAGYRHAAERRRRRISFIAVFPMLLAAAAPAMAQSADAQAPAADPFRDQADQLGVRRCADVFSALGRTVAWGSTFAVQTQAADAEPDAHSIQGVVGMTYSTPDYSGQAAGIVSAAPAGGGCEGQLVRVAPFQRACPDVLELLPAGSEPAGELSGVPLYNLGDNQGQALLVSSGETCVVVTVAQGADTG